MYTDRYRIMLAGPSLLYAPLYLARIEQLSYAFKWIDFDYPTKVDEKGKRDPLFFRLLNTQQDHDIILAVADPFRLRYKASTGHDPNEAIVIGGLIQRTCLWLIDGHAEFDPANGDKISSCFSQVVVHRPEMSSFALLSVLLKKELACVDEVKRSLFHSARVTEEHKWAWRRRLDERPMAYVTADQKHARLNDTEFIRFFDYGTEETRNLLFTGLVTKKGLWEEGNDSKRYVLEEIKQGISRAIALINDDPPWAARCLMKDQELLKRLPGRQTETQIKDYLKALVNIQAYVIDEDLRVADHLYNNGLKIHTDSDDVRPNRDDIETNAIKLKSCFAGIIDGTAAIAAASKPKPKYELMAQKEHLISSGLMLVTGYLLSLISFSLALRKATGWPSILSTPQLVRNAASWLAISDIDPVIRVGIALLSFVGALFLLPSVHRVLEEKGESRGWITFLTVFLPSTLAIAALVWVAADWKTVVGALCNWAVVFYAFYKYARRFITGSLTLSERVDLLRRKWRLAWHVKRHERAERKKGELLTSPI